MSIEFPKPSQPDSRPDSSAEKSDQVMNEQETLNLLREKGIQHVERWKPGQAVLYVFEEVHRENKAFENVPETKQPSIVRVDSPSFIDLDNPRGENDRIVYALGNEMAGQIDYYAIDATTQKPILVKTSHTVMTRDRPYNVRKETLFVAADDLFPKSNL